MIEKKLTENNIHYYMKTINTYINEKLRLTAKQKYTCQPKSKKKLQQIIIQRIENDGNDCDLNDIDVSKITDMSFLFDARSYRSTGNPVFKYFNGDLSMWDVSNVKNMNQMFVCCDKFNCDISKWDVSKVENMNNMFDNCYEFNCDISKWDVSNVTTMYGIFFCCYRFNQDLDSWDVSKVCDMDYAFDECPTQPEWYINKKQ